MACGCVTFECIRIPFDPCNTGFEIPVVAAETGNIDIEVTFNGNVTVFQVAVIQGDNIILPTSAFNESYTHEVSITQGDIETCYKLTTIPAKGLPDFEPIVPVEGGIFGELVVTEYASTLEFPAGRTIWVIYPGNQAYARNTDFTQSGTTVTLLFGQVPSGDIPATITYQYTED